ncbi:MAG TPA: hypothetical protein VJJ24_02575 [Candidatus Paceibacterota bacterium]
MYHKIKPNNIKESLFAPALLWHINHFGLFTNMARYIAKGRAISSYGIALPLLCYLKNVAKNQGQCSG